MMRLTVGYCRICCLAFIVSVVALFTPHLGLAQTGNSRLGIKAGLQGFDSFNNLGFGPTVGLIYGRHEIGGCLLWDQYTTWGGLPYYRFKIPDVQHGVSAFLQLAFPFSRNKFQNAITDPNGQSIYFDALAKGIHISLGAEIKLWKGLSFQSSAGLGHNWFHFIDYPYDNDYDLNTANMQMGLTYHIPLRKEEAVPTDAPPAPQGRLHLGLQTEYELPQRISMNPRPGAFTYHPYLEYRFARRMRVQGSVMVGGETAGGTEPDVEWGVRGVGLGVRFYSWQLKGLQFFHTVGGVFVPKPYGYLYGSQVHLANGFSFDFAKYGSLEAGMNLRFNTNTYYLAPFMGLAVRLPELGRERE